MDTPENGTPAGATGVGLPSTSPPASRRTVIVAACVVAVTVAVTVMAVMTGTRLRSPEQSAADAAPPSASLVTARVTRRVLAEPVVLRGVVRPGASVKVRVPAGAVSPTSVITDVFVRVGGRLAEGDVLAVRSEQPLVALDLPFPLYRDVTGGLRGRDVEEIQRALRRVGHPVPVTGRMDARTQAALRRFFARRGFTAPAGDPEAVRQLAEARANADRAEREYAAAVAARSRVPEARAARDAAARTVAALTVTAGPALPRSAVVRIDRTGRKITAVRIRVGSVLTDPNATLVELDGEAPYVVAAATGDQAPLLHRGQRATLQVNGGKPVPLTVTRVSAAPEAATGTGSQRDAAPDGSQPGTDQADGGQPGSGQPDSGQPDGAEAGGGQDGSPGDGVDQDSQGKSGEDSVQVRLAAGPATLPPPGDSSLRVEIAPQVSEGPVLAVPITAIYSRPDGSDFVTVVVGGRTTDVTVGAGLTAGGWVEIADATPELAEGAEVVVGYGAQAVTK